MGWDGMGWVFGFGMVGLGGLLCIIHSHEHATSWNTQCCFETSSYSFTVHSMLYIRVVLH